MAKKPTAKPTPKTPAPVLPSQPRVTKPAPQAKTPKQKVTTTPPTKTGPKTPDDIIRDQLFERLRITAQHLRTDANDMKEGTQQGDVADVAFGATEVELAARFAERGSKEITQINYALQQLAKGRYGICENCEAKINTDRLEALPYVTMCLKCQRLVEVGDVDEDAVRLRWSKLDAAADTADDGPTRNELDALAQ